MLTGCALAEPLGIILSGHELDDPNIIPQARYQMAHLHAQQALADAGFSTDHFRDQFDLEIFTRRHVDGDVVHHYELYEFLKTAPTPGPERIVIAYDDVTRTTYIRRDLRSNQDLTSLPP
jgi:hypothetical protein